MNIFSLSLMILVVITASVYTWYFASIKSLSDGECKNRFSISLLLKSKNSIKLYIAFIFVSGLALALGLLLLYPSQLELFKYQTLVLYLLLAPIAWYDYKYMKIPYKIILVGIVLRFIFYAFNLIIDSDSFFYVLKSDIIACLLLCGILLVLKLLFKKGIGMGDIKHLMLMDLHHGVVTCNSLLSLL